MSFRWLVAALGLSVFLCASCGLKIGEKAPKGAPIIIGGGRYSCLSNMSEKAEEFLSARLSVPEIRQFMVCLRDCFESFARRTRGMERDSFKPEELRDFIQEYFLKDRRISDQLLSDFMKLKQSMVGGPVDRVTRADLSQAVDFLKVLEDQAVKLQPYMGVYNFSIGRLWLQDEGSRLEVDDAVRTLEEVAQTIGARLATANHPYSLDDLESFLGEFRSFSAWERIFTNTRSARSWGVFLKSYKAILTGDDAEVVQPQHWSVLFSQSAGLYGLWLKIRYARSKNSLLSGEGLEATIRAGDAVFAWLRSAVDRQSRKVISYQQLDRLIEALPGVGLMPGMAAVDSGEVRPFRISTLKSLARALFNRMFGDPTVPWAQRQSEGMGRLAISQMSSEFSLWTEIQRFLDRTFQPDARGRQPGRLETLSERLGPVGASESLMHLMENRAPPDEGVRTIRWIEQELRPLFRVGEHQIFLTERSELARHQVVHGFHNLSIMNLIRAAVALLVRGYSSYRSGDGPLLTGVSAEELQAFYLDFRDFGVDLQLFDPHAERSGIRAFREANMFTYSGNGVPMRGAKFSGLKDLLLPTEAMEYLAFVYSASSLGREVYKGMMDPDNGVCFGASRNAPMGDHDYRMVERQCFREQFMGLFLPKLNTMPTMFKVISELSPDARMGVTQVLMDTAFPFKWFDAGFVEWNEVTTLAMVTHYTEALMTRYNRNLNEYLDDEEIWSTYETFRGYIEEMIEDWCRQDKPDSGGFVRWFKDKNCGRVPEFMAKALFAHLANTGEIPKKLSSVNWMPRAPLLGVDLKVDRFRLFKIFSSLLKVTAEPKKPPQP